MSFAAPSKCQLWQSQITLESTSAFPPHHATVKGQQQPFQSLHLRVKMLTDHALVFGNSSTEAHAGERLVSLKKHRHSLTDFRFLPQIQPALISFQYLSNKIPPNLQLTVNHTPGLAAQSAVKHLTSSKTSD